MDLLELVEDTRDGTFHKDISIGSFLGLLRHSHLYHQFVHRERVIAGQIVPGDGQNFHKAVREGLPTTRELIVLPMNYSRAAIFSAASFDVTT